MELNRVMTLDFRQWLNEANYIKLPHPMALPGAGGQLVSVNIIDMHWEWYDDPRFRAFPLKNWYVALPGRNQYLAKVHNGVIVDAKIVDAATLSQMMSKMEMELGPEPDVWINHARFFDTSSNVVKQSSKEQQFTVPKAV